jgi:hypothetical protein
MKLLKIYDVECLIRIILKKLEHLLSPNTQEICLNSVRKNIKNKYLTYYRKRRLRVFYLW